MNTNNATKVIAASLVLAACASDVKPEAPAPHAHATELVAYSAQAKAVFVGEVVAIDHRLSEPDDQGRVTPFHFVTWRVDRAVRGVDAGTTWTGRFAGGPFGDGRTLWVSAVPEFELGQRALVLANDGDAGACALAGCRDGMVVVSDARGTRLDAAALDGVIASLAPNPVATARARSVDPNKRFAFAPPAAGPIEATARVRTRTTAPRVAPVETAEHAAFKHNGRNPVIP